MRAGDLRHLVSIQKRRTWREDRELKSEWLEVHTVWAKVEPLSAREFIQAAAQQSLVTTRVTIRRTTGIDASMRIVHEGRIYNIEGVLPDRVSGREYLTLPCSEGVNEG